ncbi:CoA transferase [Actinomadura nitritigenes]|uniref:CoA transferase n=1 Tax=Actinomadura nitritigenes TaxID=134602 RepID=UPI003D94A923
MISHFPRTARAVGNWFDGDRFSSGGWVVGTTRRAAAADSAARCRARGRRGPQRGAHAHERQRPRDAPPRRRPARRRARRPRPQPGHRRAGGHGYLAAVGADVLRVDPPHRWSCRCTATTGSPATRSTPLDMRTPDGLDRLHALLDRVDVLVHGHRPGALAAFGLNHGPLARRHPDLVMLSLSAGPGPRPYVEPTEQSGRPGRLLALARDDRSMAAQPTCDRHDGAALPRTSPRRTNA